MPLSSPTGGENTVLPVTTLVEVVANIPVAGLVNLNTLNFIYGDASLVQLNNGGVEFLKAGAVSIISQPIQNRSGVNGLALGPLAQGDNVQQAQSLRLFTDPAKTAIILDDGKTNSVPANAVNILNNGVNTDVYWTPQTQFTYLYDNVAVGNTLFINQSFFDLTGVGVPVPNVWCSLAITVV